MQTYASASPVSGKYKRGIKCSLAVDARGIPLGATIAPANRRDSPLLADTLEGAGEALAIWPSPEQEVRRRRRNRTPRYAPRPYRLRRRCSSLSSRYSSSSAASRHFS